MKRLSILFLTLTLLFPIWEIAQADNYYGSADGVESGCDYGSLNEIVNTWGTRPIAIHIGCTLNVRPGSNLTIPDTITLRQDGNALINIPDGVTVTHQGVFKAGPVPVFNTNNTGIFRFQTNKLEAIYAEWWGAKADYTKNSGPAIRAALVAAKDLYKLGSGAGYAAHVQLLGGGYMIDSPGAFVSCYVKLKGLNQGGTQIQTIGTGNDYNVLSMDGTNDPCPGAGGYTLYSAIEDLRIIKVGGTTASSCIFIQKAFQVDIKNVNMNCSTGNGVQIYDSNTVSIYHSEIGGDINNSTGRGLDILRANGSAWNVSMENFWQGFYCKQTVTTPCNFALYSPYFENGNGYVPTDNTYMTFDATLGSSVFNPTVKGGGGTRVAVSFINGAHHNHTFGGMVGAVGDSGYFPAFKTDATSFHNCFYGTNWNINGGTTIDQDTCIDGNSPHTQNYQITMTPDLWKYNDYRITFDSGSAWTLNAPINAQGPRQKLRYMFRNASGGAMGAATFNAVFKMPAFVAPANGFSRTYDFECDGTNCVEVFRSAADSPN